MFVVFLGTASLEAGVPSDVDSLFCLHGKRVEAPIYSILGLKKQPSGESGCLVMIFKIHDWGLSGTVLNTVMQVVK